MDILLKIKMSLPIVNWLSANFSLLFCNWSDHKMPSLVWETHTSSCKYVGLIFVGWWRRMVGRENVTTFPSKYLLHWFKMWIFNFSWQCWNASVLISKSLWFFWKLFYFPRFMKCEVLFFFLRLSKIWLNVDYKSEAFNIWFFCFQTNRELCMKWFWGVRMALARWKPAPCTAPSELTRAQEKHKGMPTFTVWGAPPKSNKKP